MEFFKTDKFFKKVVILCSLIPVLLVAQRVVEAYIDNTSEEASLYSNSLIELKNDCRDLRTGEAFENSQKLQLVKKLDSFRENRTLDSMGDQAELLSALGKRIERKALDENTLDNNLSALVYRIKMKDDAVDKAARDVTKNLEAILVSLDSYQASLRTYATLLLATQYVTIAIILLVLMRMIRSAITSRISSLNDFTGTLINGSYSDSELIEKSDAIGKLSRDLNIINSNFKKATHYIQDLSSDSQKYNPSEEDKENELLRLIDGLAKQIVQRGEQDERRNWVNVGIAKFGDILQDHNMEMKDFGDRIISELVKYIGANQGVIFYLQSTEEEDYLELLSTYAWGKKRFSDNKIALDSANLLTEAIKGREHIYLKEIPEDFVRITSGLGDANPKAVVIIPLIANEEPIGVIELASFHEFENYKIDFLTKICESISGTFASISTSEKTKRLLERSQTMTEQLRAQEEALRQNAEELEASRENLNRELELAKLEMQQQVEVIEGEKLKNIAILEGCVDGVVIFKEDGIVDFFNKSAEEIWNVSREEIKGKSIKKLFPVEICEEDDEYHIYYTGEGQFKRIDVRTEISCFGPAGDELTLLVTASSGEVKGSQTFAFFVQTLTVELF